MELSLQEFKKEFNNYLIEVHWKHWSALGIASHIEEETNWIIDLEALIISTLAIGLLDKRLLLASREWIMKNGKWINFSRLRRIGDVFTQPFLDDKASLISMDLLNYFADFRAQHESAKLFNESHSPYAQEEKRYQEYKDVLRNLKTRNVVTRATIRRPSLLQLLFRGIFGIDARADILIYLLIKGSGNSNAMAKEVFYNQKNVYNILERWTQAEMLIKIAEKRESRYSFNRKKELLKAFGIKRIPRYINWSNTFLLLNKIARALTHPQWSEDKYLLSSLVRDYLNDTKAISRALDITITEPSLFPGAQYFEPLAQGLLSIVKKLNATHGTT